MPEDLYKAMKESNSRLSLENLDFSLRIKQAIQYIKENLSWVNGIDELLNILEGGQNDTIGKI